MQITIRKLKESDIAELARIERESFSRPWSEESFRELLTLDYARYLVAEADGEIAGSAGMRVVYGEGDIDNVVVDRKYRGNGIAKALISELIALGESEGIKEFTLEVRVSNAAAIRVYENAGFTSAGVRPRFYEDPVEDALIMWRRG
ncbi:MAG: ribosomal protein S18-alanine N-acetyltransferase [Lachnospiraceae bacterium]|jgi:ribosomal-protein-alanine N-acetyltransferase|nr:ribosomal protein S18-alanine N-acetyltransferase [Lachnospiraceae bacterium]